jgi:hypothetical protein
LDIEELEISTTVIETCELLKEAAPEPLENGELVMENLEPREHDSTILENTPDRKHPLSAADLESRKLRRPGANLPTSARVPPDFRGQRAEARQKAIKITKRKQALKRSINMEGKSLITPKLSPR